MLMVEEEERFQKYADYIAGEKAHIHAIGKKQKEIINQENPSPEICDNLTSSKGKDSLILGERWYNGYPFCIETIFVAIPG